MSSRLRRLENNFTTLTDDEKDFIVATAEKILADRNGDESGNKDTTEGDEKTPEEVPLT